jgi:hypothetical protein
MDQYAFVIELSKIRSSSTFLSLRGYRSQSSEIADYTLCFHMSYKNALEKSIATLEAMSLSNDIDRQAREELLASYRKSLSNPEPIEERESAYDYFVNDDGSTVKGIKIHRDTGTLHIYGLLHQKRVLMPGIPKKPINSKPLTIAKRRLESVCSVGRFRQFKITSENVDSISVENMNLLPPEE